MFGIDWSNPETLWLNLTNLGLGLLVLGCLAVFAYGAVQEVLVRFKRRSEASEFSPHVLHTPELGFTMADGGDPVSETTTKPAESSRLKS